MLAAHQARRRESPLRAFCCPLVPDRAGRQGRARLHTATCKTSCVSGHEGTRPSEAEGVVPIRAFCVSFRGDFSPRGSCLSELFSRLFGQVGSAGRNLSRGARAKSCHIVIPSERRQVEAPGFSAAKHVHIVIPSERGGANATERESRDPASARTHAAAERHPIRVPIQSARRNLSRAEPREP